MSRSSSSSASRGSGRTSWADALDGRRVQPREIPHLHRQAPAELNRPAITSAPLDQQRLGQSRVEFVSLMATSISGGTTSMPARPWPTCATCWTS